MNKLFKSRMFGYSKKAVNAYVEEFSNITKQKIEENEDKIDDLEKKIEELREKNEKLEKDATMISNAIITAEKKAEEIVSAAQEKADKIIEDAENAKEVKMAEIANETKEAEMKLRKLNEEIRQLKTNIIISANKYTKELDQLID